MASRRKYTKQAQEIGVYGICCKPTGQWYIGSSIALSNRMGVHLRELRKGKHHSWKLQRAYNCYGEAAFEFQVLLFCSKDEVHAQEQKAIDDYHGATDGLNVAACPRGGFMRGRHWPEGTKAARVEAMRGFKHTDESKAKIKAALAKMTPEARKLKNQRIGEANRAAKATKVAEALQRIAPTRSEISGRLSTG